MEPCSSIQRQPLWDPEVVPPFEIADTDPAFNFRCANPQVSPHFDRSALNFAPSGLAKVDNNPGKRPLSRFLYALGQQLENFELEFDAQIPVSGIGKKKSSFTLGPSLKLGQRGVISALGISASPGYKPICIVSVLKVIMDPENRLPRVKVCLIGIPISMDIKNIPEFIVNWMKLDPKLSDTLRTEVPGYIWQAADQWMDLAEELKGKPPAAPASATEPQAKVNLEEASLTLRGNFSNKKLDLGPLLTQFTQSDIKGLSVEFAEGKDSVITISGKLTEPDIRLSRFKTVNYEAPPVKISLSHADPSQPFAPLEIHAKIDPNHPEFPELSIPTYKNSGLSLKAQFPDKNGQLRNVAFDLKQGFDVQELVFRRQSPTLMEVEAKKLSAKEIDFGGFGLKISTREKENEVRRRSQGWKDTAVLSNMKLALETGKDMRFNAQVSGQPQGEVRYFINNNDQGSISYTFNSEAVGEVIVGPDATGETKITLRGQTDVDFPDLKIVKLFSQAYISVAIEDANLKAQHGELTVNPYNSDISLHQVKGPTQPPIIAVEGDSGNVTFGMKPDKIAVLKDFLDKNFSPLISRFLELKGNVQISEIQWKIRQFDLKSETGPLGQPSLRVKKADLENIRLEGTADFVLFSNPKGSLPGVTVSIEMDRLVDEGYPDSAGNPQDHLRIEGLRLKLQDPTKTIDRCHEAHQIISLKAKSAVFIPEEKKLVVEGFEEDPKVVLKNPFGTGCFYVEEKK